MACFLKVRSLQEFLWIFSFCSDPFISNVLKVGLEFFEARHTITSNLKVSMLDFLSDFLNRPNLNMIDFFNLGNEI